MSDRQYDVVLLGATGFTGGLTAEHLARRTTGTTVRWAIAGRDRDKLEAVAQRLPGDPPAVEVVDVHDIDAVTRLAERTTALATTVGPFADHGLPVVDACVRAGTEYADITGEPGFVADVRRRFDEGARAAGIRLVSCCGFDSVPHDLGVGLAVEHLPDDAPLTVRGYVEADARFSGGTARSALQAIATRSFPSSRVDGDPAREVRSLPQRIHRIDPAVGIDGYGVPLPTIDPAIVLRSAATLDGYGAKFRYGHFARVRTLPVVVGGLAGVAAFGALASLPPTRALLDRVLPSSGEGPSAARRARSTFAATFHGVGGGQQVVTRVSGGDPGYDETAKMLGEAVLTLAQDAPSGHLGAVTPAQGLGAGYRRRLEAQGLRFEVLSTS
ncbi:MAG: saccharopine dehydrogenase NADP-binding domain-containing protein [Nitriliruptor sp.]